MEAAVKLDMGLLTYDLKGIGAFAERAEAMGFDGLWTSETRHDPFLPLAVAATRTSRLTLGTAIAVAFPRSPMILAYTAWDLQAASGGRFILGLGTQVKAHNERRFSVRWESPGPRLREVIQALRAIWASWQNGTKLDFRGQFYTFTLMTPFFQPPPIAHPRIPIFIAAVNPFMARLAGELCDGLHVHPFHSVKYLKEILVPAVEEGLRRSGRKRTDIQLAAPVFTITGETEQEIAQAKQAVKEQIAFYASTRTYEGVLAVHGWEDLSPKLHRKSLEGDWQGMADLISDEMLDAYAVSGTFETIGGRIKERYTGLLDRVWLYRPTWLTLDDPGWEKLLQAFHGEGG